MLVPRIHPTFRQVVQTIEKEVADVDGWLSRRDIHFLSLVAAHPCAKGEILEVGAFRGKSSIVLAMASQLAGQEKIYSCDPLNCDAPASHPVSIAIRKELDRNLARKKVDDRVEFHQMFSHDLSMTWSKPIRMLWLDGDHHLDAVRQDLQDFGRYLTDGAIVAMHDVLSVWDGVGRVFAEDVLASPHFGHAGINGNIAWAQYRRNTADTTRFQSRKQKLAAGLRPLIPIQTAAAGASVHGWNKLRFRYLRWRAQSRPLAPETWLRQVA
jgi:predicted O-methyltransferase YrrM